MTYPGLEGRTVVVTGAAGGQGAAEALLLAAAGADVTVGCVDETATPFQVCPPWGTIEGALES